MKKAILLLLFIAVKDHAFLQIIPTHSTLLFTSKPNSRVSIDSLYTYRLDATDSTGKLFSFGIKGLPAWMGYNAATKTISGKPILAGQYPVHLTVSNGDTLVNQQFMLTVYNSETSNLLCLGNSITNGTSHYNSYRRHLWQLLHKNNYNIDMIGSWSSHHMGGAVPDPDFDMDHEGHSGWTAADVLNPPDWDKQRGNIQQWLQTYTPDLALLELGTNEVFQCVPAAEGLKNISSVIDSLRKNNAHVKIFLAQIPPLGAQWATKKLCGDDVGYAQRVIAFNDAIKVFATEKNTTASPVIIVDQYSGIDSSTNMYDDIHPNDSGEKIMAERWFNAIRPFLKKL